MESDIRVSVAMATYNGEKYIKEQIDSILRNLNENDELVISDDGSNDRTLDIINGYNDNRIRILDGPRKGVKKNFENAIKNTKGKYIFLSDQDDIWNQKKIEKVLEEFSKNINISLIVHDAIVFNSENDSVIFESFFDYRKSKKGIIRNILKNSYIGCCMAFKSELKKYLMEIPDTIEMHDQWIGIINEIYGNNTKFVPMKLIKYRRHVDNVSKMVHYSIGKMIKNRLILITELIKFNR